VRTIAVHPLFLLAIATFVLIVAFLVWNVMSTKRHRFGRNNPAGIGGVSDPMAGASDNVRPAEEINASLDRGNIEAPLPNRATTR
jgi:hypothetical protein